MAYRYDKQTQDIVIDGWELGIARSAHDGIANIQNANISTENKEIMMSYPRIQESQSAVTGGTITQASTNSVTFSTTTLAGSWITISASSISGLSTGVYFVLSSTQISSSYAGTAITGMGVGTATYNTNVYNVGLPVGQATESYFDSSGVQQYRYYVLDQGGLVWVRDTSLSYLWALPYNASVGTYATGVTTASGINVLNGWLFIFAGNQIRVKPTVNLGGVYSTFSAGTTMGLLDNKLPHFAFVGHQGTIYYTDGTYIGSVFPNSSLGTTETIINIQSYASYTAVTTTGTISTLINGSLPTPATTGTPARVPVFPFTATGGTKPDSIVVGTKYYLQWLNSGNTFEIYSTPTGGSALNLSTGAIGTQYFNTFYPASGDGNTVMTFAPQRLNLPFFETAQVINELNETSLLIGAKSNAVYTWNQLISNTLFDSLIFVPENNITQIVIVNNMGYIFAGNKGNIYITNGSTASLVIKVPDYCAGLPGTPTSYVEPYFIWGGAMYLKGRVYFSILDQTTTKTGQCGGVWSFIPTQNMFIGQDTGISLRQENQSSYASYNGVCTLLIPNQNQLAKSPQYWSAWYSSVTSPLYGIDNTASSTGTSMVATVIETDLIPIGTMLDKKSLSGIEYKLATPNTDSEEVIIAYRTNEGSTYTTIDDTTVIKDTTFSLSGYYKVPFEKTQWLQLRIRLISSDLSGTSFVRLTEVRLRTE